MKKNLIASYIEGIRDLEHGEGYLRILRYFFPEFVTAFVLYSALYFVDALFISELRSTSTYATLGLTNTILHFIVKMAEGLSISTVILSGEFNGSRDYKDVGRTLKNSFWISFITGAFFALFLYFGAYWIYYLYGVPAKMIKLGIPFLRIRAVGIFFMFIYFSFIGFLRGIKNTKTPMKFFIAGAMVFLFFDYALIFGKFGFPKMGLNGSALATLIQYVVMFVYAFTYSLFCKENRKYSIKLFSYIANRHIAKNLIFLSIPIVIDKSSIALAYIWLGKMLSYMGKYSLASFTVIKDMERFAFLPALGFAQVITFLVSNNMGSKNWIGIKSNIKKVVFLSSIFTFIILIVFSIWPENIVKLFDKKGVFTKFSAQIFPILSILLFFDLLQLILSAALRGAANVGIVMKTRIVLILTFFMPISYILSTIPIHDPLLKFILIYGSFYVGSGLMSIVYIWRFRGEMWKKGVE